MGIISAANKVKSMKKSKNILTEKEMDLVEHLMSTP